MVSIDFSSFHESVLRDLESAFKATLLKELELHDTVEEALDVVIPRLFDALLELRTRY